MKKIRKGDKVIIIAGKDKGKVGVILAIVDQGERVVVDGVNMAKKHVKPNPNINQQGGIVPKPMPIHRSNVMAYDGAKRSRIGIRTLNDGQRVRIFKSNDQVIDINK